MVSESSLTIGGYYNFIGQDDVLVFVGKYGLWNQFELFDEPGEIWCEILNVDLPLIECNVKVNHNVA